MATAPTIVKAAPKKATTTTWTTDSWTTLLLDVLNQTLKAQGKKLIPISTNNIDNIERMMATEVAGQQGGFLRDNNPLNTGTYPGTPGLYGGHVVMKFGTTINQFSTPLAGAQGTAIYLQKYGTNLIAALQQDAPTALFAGASPWWKVGSTPLKETTTGPVGPVGPVSQPPAGVANQHVVNQILAQAATAKPWSAALRAEYLSLSAADRAATTKAVYAVLAKERNLSSMAQIAAFIASLPGAAKRVATDTSAPLNSIASDFSGLGTILSDLGSATWWKRVGIFVGGLALLGGGAVVFLSTTKPGQAMGVLGGTGNLAKVTDAVA